MSEGAKLLVKHGFISKQYKNIYAGKSEKEKEELVKKTPIDVLEKHADEEELEVLKDQIMTTGYPNPFHRYRIVIESYQYSIEEVYYWLLNYLRYDLGFPIIDKIIDVFAAAEHSAFFGVAQQRLGLQQDKVTQFLATIGKMVRELFQLVREIRILDERIHYYTDSYDVTSKSRESAEITLKGIYIDQVEGGAKSPASVYGMSRELGFTTLPDLFFSIHPVKSTDVDEEVDKLEFNRKVKEVLKRKLRSYLEWKESTFKELRTRRIFTVKYLRQHYEVIRMYMSWVKPYLRNIRRLQSETKEMEKPYTPDLVSAFEGSLVEIEILASEIAEGNKRVYSCILMNFLYRTRPAMSFQQEGYQRGPLHVGETRITYRAYTWTEEQIKNYKKMREEEDFELLSIVDGSVKAAMEALGDELMQYLNEAGEEFKKIEPKEIRRPGIITPFAHVFLGFGELFGIKKDELKPKRKKKVDPYIMGQEVSRAQKMAKAHIWLAYKNFKKAYKMLSW